MICFVCFYGIILHLGTIIFTIKNSYSVMVDRCRQQHLMHDGRGHTFDEDIVIVDRIMYIQLAQMAFITYFQYYAMEVERVVKYNNIIMIR